jgi:nucleoside-diphosphate-sugar epimerase
MRVLVIGGSGYVGTLALPALARRHQLRVLDIKPPTDELTCEYVAGDANDATAVSAACAGVDAVIHMAMARMSDPHHGRSAAEHAAAFDIHVKSVYLALSAAGQAGIRHAIHVSSLSVHADLGHRPITPTDTPDATDPYALTKRLGEEAARAAAALDGMALTILRLAWPTPDEAWPEWAVRAASVGPAEPHQFVMHDGTPVPALAGSDLAAALAAALENPPRPATPGRPAEVRALPLAGDTEGIAVDLTPIRDALGWWPTRHP